MEQRRKRLLRHLRAQAPYATTRAEASEMDLLRWKKQLNDCRRAKMLTLLLAHLARRDTGWEALDETLLILDILVFSAFRYRGPVEVCVEIGARMDVQDYLVDQGAHTKKELVGGLTGHFQHTIETMVGDSRSGYLGR
jgi:hypothetical protein